MHWSADHLVLWQAPVTRPSLLSAHIYYADTLVDMPPLFNAVQYAVGIAGSLILILKAAGGRESNWLFDGASLCERPRRQVAAASPTVGLTRRPPLLFRRSVLYGASGLVTLQKIVPSTWSLAAMC